ncbi:response regulator [Devosia honganensis]|uniref:Response regulator n=1 Tax=Devosia honganensis TaxID=1610527 RepID=A0ABV7X2Q8_9HYPH
MTKARATIAVVDDDMRMLESLSDLLEASGYHAISFQSATALIEEGLREVDLIVADIGMPGMDGFELRDIAQRERPSLPVFLITGRHELAERGRIRGGSQVFRKPFDTGALLAAVAGALHPIEQGE